MLKGSEVIGRPVVAFEGGERLETVRDVIFDHRVNRVAGFLVDAGGWFRAARVVPWAQVRTIGQDAVVVASRDSVRPADREPLIARILERENVLKGTRLMTTDGRVLGTLRDLWFDERDGRVDGYEVSGGLLADARDGRAYVPARHTLEVGDDVAFVSPEAEAFMVPQGTGGKRRG
jgi:uncharacterized protein YrrD